MPFSPQPAADPQVQDDADKSADVGRPHRAGDPTDEYADANPDEEQGEDKCPVRLRYLDHQSGGVGGGDSESLDVCYQSGGGT